MDVSEPDPTPGFEHGQEDGTPGRQCIEYEVSAVWPGKDGTRRVLAGGLASVQGSQRFDAAFDDITRIGSDDLNRTEHRVGTLGILVA